MQQRLRRLRGGMAKVPGSRPNASHCGSKIDCTQTGGINVGENPDYWTTIATVIPVLALTLATVYKNNKWHSLSTFDRRWSAAYGIVLVILLAYVEYLSLAHLQERSSNALAERLALIVVSVIAFQVIALPLLPLGLIALHDLHPQVRRAKRSLRVSEKEFKVLQKRYRREMKALSRMELEMQIEASEQIIGEHDLVFSADGTVRPDVLTRVPRLHEARESRKLINQSRLKFDRKIDKHAKKLRRARRRQEEALARRTKSAARVGHSRLL